MIKLKTLLKEIRSVKEDSGEALNTQKDKWITFDPKPKEKELDDEFFKLIQTAYKEIGGHAKVKSPNDVFSDPDWTFWQGVDIHGSPDLDLIVWGQHTKYGVKFSGVGHDGEKDSTREYLNHKSEVLKKPGYYGEVSR